MKTSNLIKASSIVLLAFFFFAQTTNAQKGKKKADKQTIAWRYELEVVGTGIEGTYQVKAWTYSQNVETATEQGKKNAVHGVIFKGFGDNGPVKGQKALVIDPNSQEDKKDYWETFFKSNGGKYMKFVTLANNGQIGPGDRIKISKKEYKIGVIVSVNVLALRKQLEADGIVKALGADIGSKPSIMVLPDDVWCTEKGYILKFNNQGTEVILPDYDRAFRENKDLLSVTTKIGALFTDRGYSLVNAKALMDKIKNNNAKNSMNMSNESGSGIAESPIDILNRTAKADFIIKVSWSMETKGPENQITYNMLGIDAYTSKQKAASEGTGRWSSASSVPVLLRVAVVGNMDVFNTQLMSHFADIRTNGREGSLVIQVWDDAMDNLETEYEVNGDSYELKQIIEELWMGENTVNNTFKLDEASENTMKFSDVRIPLKITSGLSGKEMNNSFSKFGSTLQKFLKRYDIVSKVQPRGLGEVYVILGGK